MVSFGGLKDMIWWWLEMNKCKWILYDYRTICPENHEDVCDGSIDNPFWRLHVNYKKVIKYCPYCGKEIDYSEIDK